MRNTKNASQRRHAAGRELARIVTGIAARITVLTGALAALTPLPSQAASPGAWSQNPVVGTPPRRSDHAAAYDLARHRTVVFGGFDATFAPTADTFEFDGVTWSAVMPPTAPHLT